MLSAAPCRADSARILLVSDPDTPEELAKSARSSLDSAFDLADSSAYLAAARAQHLSPTSVAALMRLAPKAHARLVVTLEPTPGKLQVTVRDGNSGDVISEQSLAARGRHPKLSARAKRKLTAGVRRALSRGASARGRAAADSDDDDDDTDLGEASAAGAKPSASTWAQATAPKRQVLQPTAAPVAPRDDLSDSSEPQADESVTDEGAEPSSPTGASDPFAVRVSVGGGGGGRVAVVPTRSGGRDLDSGFSLPALELGLDLRYLLGSHWLLGGALEFRTFFGLQAPGALPDGTLQQTAISSRSLVLGLAPGYRFGGSDAVVFRVLVGWTFRMLQSSDVEHAGASIQAAVVRPELRIPLGSAVMLHLAPEVLVIVDATATLPRNISGLARLGVGLGGELGLDVHVGGPLYLGVAYRESHGMVASAWSTGFADIERYAVGRIGLQL